MANYVDMITRMIVRQLMRRGVNAGINAGINAFGKGRKGDQRPQGASKEQKKAVNQAAKATRMARRLRKF